MKRSLVCTILAVLIMAPALASDDHAADTVEHYVIDTRGAHAFVQFRISHLGFSWLYGRFNEFSGDFSFDPVSPENSSVEVTIQTASIDSNHERRDKHLRDPDFLAVEDFPEAHFQSTRFEPLGDDRYRMTGRFTLLGVTRMLEFEVEQVGAGLDPWGGFRRGFEGRTRFALADFGIDYDLGEEARTIEIILSVEGIRQDGDA